MDAATAGKSGPGAKSLGEVVEPNKACVAGVAVVLATTLVAFGGDAITLGRDSGRLETDPAHSVPAAPATMYRDGMNPIADLGGWSKSSGSGWFRNEIYGREGEESQRVSFPCVRSEKLRSGGRSPVRNKVTGLTEEATKAAATETCATALSVRAEVLAFTLGDVLAAGGDEGKNRAAGQVPPFVAAGEAEAKLR